MEVCEVSKKLIMGVQIGHLGCLNRKPGVSKLETWDVYYGKLGCLIWKPGVFKMETWESHMETSGV